MITGFEEKTKPLTEDEEKYLSVLVKAFETMKKGKKNAVNASYIIERLATLGIFIDQIRLRKLIQHIRVNNMVYGLCSSSAGYFISENADELLSTLKSLKERIENQTSTFKALRYQYNFLYNNKEEVKEENKLF